MAVADFRVVITDGVIRHHRPDGIVETIRRKELKAVILEANALGPYVTDVFWILMGKRRGRTFGCYIPSGATGEDQVLAYLRTLPGFDASRLPDAMDSYHAGKWVVWERGAVPVSPPR